MATLSDIKPFNGISASYALQIYRQLLQYFTISMIPLDATESQVEAAIDELTLLYGNQIFDFPQIYINRINDRLDKNLINRFKNEFKLDLASIIESEGLDDYIDRKTKENVSLIKKLHGETRDKTEGLIRASLSDPNTNLNDSIKNIRGEIGALRRSAKARAKLIARDQTAKIQSQIHQQRVERLGSVEYEWVTSRDERVRDSHKKNNGKTFRWDSPPRTGHPADDIQCRCTAKAVFDIDRLISG